MFCLLTYAMDIPVIAVLYMCIFVSADWFPHNFVGNFATKFMGDTIFPHFQVPKTMHDYVVLLWFRPSLVGLNLANHH